MKKSLTLLALLSFHSGAYAVGEANRYIADYVRADKSGFGYVKFTQPLAGTPATCIGGGHTNHLSFDTKTDGGKAILAVVLSAQATGNPVIARGTGTCDQYVQVESWSFGYVVKP